MIFLTKPPAWLPSLVQPADWLIIKILAILVVTSLVAAFYNITKGVKNGKSV